MNTILPTSGFARVFSGFGRHWPGRFNIGPVSWLLAQAIAWQDRATQRRNLTELDDWQLKDIGISRCDAAREAAKPFWRA